MKARQRKFEYWYRLFNNGNWSNIVSTVNTKQIKVEAVFIFRNDNLLAYDLPIIIEQAKDDLLGK